MQFFFLGSNSKIFQNTNLYLGGAFRTENAERLNFIFSFCNPTLYNFAILPQPYAFVSIHFITRLGLGKNLRKSDFLDAAEKKMKMSEVVTRKAGPGTWAWAVLEPYSNSKLPSPFAFTINTETH